MDTPTDHIPTPGPRHTTPSSPRDKWRPDFPSTVVPVLILGGLSGLGLGGLLPGQIPALILTVVGAYCVRGLWLETGTLGRDPHLRGWMEVAILTLLTAVAGALGVVTALLTFMQISNAFTHKLIPVPVDSGLLFLALMVGCVAGYLVCFAYAYVSGRNGRASA